MTVDGGDGRAVGGLMGEGAGGCWLADGRRDVLVGAVVGADGRRDVLVGAVVGADGRSGPE